MDPTTNPSKPPLAYFGKGLAACVLILGFGIYLSLRSSKPKAEFDQALGQVVYLDKSLGELPRKHAGKYRYLALSTYPTPFELFAGHDKWDFSPALDRLDLIRLGDTVVIYFDGISGEAKYGVNKNVQFIDRREEAIFVRGRKDIYGAVFFIGFSIIMIPVLFIMRRTGKIV